MKENRKRQKCQIKSGKLRKTKKNHYLSHMQKLDLNLCVQFLLNYNCCKVCNPA